MNPGWLGMSVSELKIDLNPKCPNDDDVHITGVSDGSHVRTIEVALYFL